MAYVKVTFILFNHITKRHSIRISPTSFIKVSRIKIISFYYLLFHHISIKVLC